MYLFQIIMFNGLERLPSFFLERRGFQQILNCFQIQERSAGPIASRVDGENLRAENSAGPGVRQRPFFRVSFGDYF